MGSAQPESLKRRGRKGRWGQGGRPTPENRRHSCPEAPPAPPHRPPLPEPRVLSRDRRPPRPGCGPSPSRSGHLRPRTTPGERLGPSCRRRPVHHRLRGVTELSEMLTWVSAVREEVGFYNGCQGPAVRDGIATRVLPTVSAQQGMMKSYGVSVLVYKNRREFHLVGMISMWLCQKRGKV